MKVGNIEKKKKENDKTFYNKFSTMGLLEKASLANSHKLEKSNSRRFTLFYLCLVKIIGIWYLTDFNLFYFYRLYLF